jgi:hypothetical protein
MKIHHKDTKSTKEAQRRKERAKEAEAAGPDPALPFLPPSLPLCASFVLFVSLW